MYQSLIKLIFNGQRKMSTIVYLHVFLLCIGKYSANTNDTFPEQVPDGRMQSLRNLCPYNKFCGSAPLKKIKEPDHEPCCQECSCEKDCFETGTCCPDMPLSDFVDPKFPCKHLWDFGKVYAETTFPTESDFWYHVIDNCPAKVIPFSYLKCLKPNEIEDFVIVSDSRTGKLYRNKYCAECNGIHNYTNLKLRIDCYDIASEDMLSLGTVNERNKYVMQNCSLLPLPPVRRNSMSHCLPESHVISTCNSSGKWDIYNPEIEKGCMASGKGQNMVYRKQSVKSDKKINYYANVFCFLCNMPADAERTDSCNIIELSDNEKSGIVKLYAILDISVLEDDILTEEESICHSAEIWDPFSKLCRRMSCPVGYIPDHGTCKGLFSNIKGYSFAINFIVNFKKKTNVSDPVLLHILKNRVILELGKDITCGMCEVTLWTRGSHIFYQHILFSTEGCPYSTLLERLRKLAIKKEIAILLRYNGQLVSIELVLIFEKVNYQVGYNILEDSLTSFCHYITPIDASILYHCPSIELLEEEIRTLGIGDVYNHSATVVVNRNESNRMFQRVCVDSYFSAKEEINSASTAIKPFTIYRIVELLVIMITNFFLSRF